MEIDTQNIKKHNLRAEIKGSHSDAVERLKGIRENIITSATVQGCLKNGYAPYGYTLTDFSIVKTDKIYHLFYTPMVLPAPYAQYLCHTHWLGHAYSKDLDTWVTCDPVLTTNTNNYYETSHIWAPFVYSENTLFYMYYAGLTDEPSQVICLATSKDPELTKWKKHSQNPLIPFDGYNWHWLNEWGHVRHCRDPHVIKIDRQYLMAYTAMHKSGCPAVGGIISKNLISWEDIGPILYRPIKKKNNWPESVNIQRLPEGRYVLMPSQSPGITYYISDSPYSWHGIKPQQIEYSDGPNADLIGIEVIEKKGNALKWVVAFFSNRNNRLMIGILDYSRNPWTISRVKDLKDIEKWLD